MMLTCPEDNGDIYTAQNGDYFVIECGTDHLGGNLGMTYVGSFQECVERCSTNPQCVDVSLSGAACYMKSSVGNAVDGPVWGARQVSQEEA